MKQTATITLDDEQARMLVSFMRRLQMIDEENALKSMIPIYKMFEKKFFDAHLRIKHRV